MICAASVAFPYLAMQIGNEQLILSKSERLSPAYEWLQVAPPGSGTHQHEWKPGTYPSAIVPVIAFNDDLWMVGQKRVWSSKDGIKWQASDKNDWGERISMAAVFFNNTFWVSGGMDYATNNFLNEIWSSKDGKTWTRSVSHAEWTARKGHTVVAFRGKLWLFGGETAIDENKVPNAFVNDIWSSSDGVHWTMVASDPPWPTRGNPKVLVFKDKLWLIGGQGRSDIWRSDDGKNWTQLKTESPWGDRYDYGLTTFDNKIWIYGGSERNRRNAFNDVWYTTDGLKWIKLIDHAPWTPRSGGFSVAFHDKLFLYGGKHTGHDDSFSGDIWVMKKRPTENK